MRRHGCARCGGDMFVEADIDSPSVRYWVCFQCGSRIEFLVEVAHPPAAPESAARQTMEANARSDSIAYLKTVERRSTAEIQALLQVGRRTVHRSLQRALARRGGGHE